jgi:branched-chain amino acid transport system substrate-binding protein
VFATDKTVMGEEKVLSMRKRFGWRVGIPVGLLVVAVSLTIASTGFGKTAGAVKAAAALKCGMGTGTPATGTPIQLGAIVTNQPGTSFTDIPNMANAYFMCVNANGGINGHPIDYTILQEQTNPAQVAADANQLINTDHVVGIVGSSSIIDGAVNGATYAKDGYNTIEVGIAQQDYSSPWNASVNMGPRFSGDGEAQTAIAHGAKKLVVDQSNVPGTGYNIGGIEDIARAHHIPVVSLTATAASLNGETEAERIVQAAGPHGAAILIYIPPVAEEILQGAQKLGLENKILWTCVTTCNTDSLAAGLGSGWNHKLLVNAEMNDTHDDHGPDTALYLKVLKQYGSAVTGGIGSFSQFGFTAGQIAVKALLSIKSQTYTVATVSAAIKAVKDFKTDMLCKPWYFGTGSVHLPNNADYTVWPQNGTMQIVPHSGCLQISPLDPEVKTVLAYEKTHGA